MKLHVRVALIVAVFGLLAVVFANVALYFHLTGRDLSDIRRSVRQTAALIRTGLLNTMIQTGDYVRIRQIVQDMRKDLNFEFRIIKNSHVIRQHGANAEQLPMDALERKALTTGEVVEHMDTPSSLRIIYPFVTDERCGSCHMDNDGQPVKPGMINGAAVIQFDLTGPQQKTREIIRNIMILMSVLTAGFFLVFLSIINRVVTRPIHDIAEAITGLQNENFDVSLPEYSTREIDIMATEVRKTAANLAARRRDREREIQDERAHKRELERLLRSRASALGVDVDSEIPEIIGRLTTAVDEVEKHRLRMQVFRFVEEERSRVVIPNDPDLIPAVGSYISAVSEASLEGVKGRTMELAVDEALNNAIYHGNLEVPSSLKSEDFDAFYALALRRRGEAPYRSRKVEIHYDYSPRRLKVTIRDEGPGFDWSRALEEEASPAELPHGRGLIIMKALSSGLSYNEKGNELTLVFDFEATANNV